MKTVPPLLNVRLCLFCEHFSWSKEEMWGMGSTLTGPMFEGGTTNCAKEHLPYEHPYDDSDWRRIILTAARCKDFTERDAARDESKQK